MKTNLNPWRIVIPLMVGALVLIGADAPAPSPDSKDPDDNDGMESEYEIFYGLDPANPDDARADYDGDLLANMAEFAKLTDPFAFDTDRDLFSDSEDKEISRGFLEFGNPQFTHGELYSYAAPAWLANVYKIDGDWETNPSCWHVAAAESNDIGSLNVDLDRGLLGTNGLCYQLTVWDHTNASLYVDLIGTNENILAADLYGNLLRGTETNVILLLDVPLGNYPAAAVIHLRRGTGECTVWEGLIFEDADFDGLDAAQEQQTGNSDYKIDSNGNGKTDFEEVFGRVASTNAPLAPGGGEPDTDDNESDSTGVIYVSQAHGSDSNNGRAAAVSGKNGPKKTVGKGMAAVDKDRAHTLVIKSGTYNENLNLIGKNVRVVIDGKVKL